MVRPRAEPGLPAHLAVFGTGVPVDEMAFLTNCHVGAHNPHGGTFTVTGRAACAGTVVGVKQQREHDWAVDVVYNWDRVDPPWQPDELTERLWLGGTPRTDVVVPPGQVAAPWAPSAHRGLFDSCVTLTPIAGPAGDGVLELRVPLRDRDGEQLDLQMLAAAIQWAVDRHRDGHRVLVRCHAGLNRSGLVAVPLLTWLVPDMTFAAALEHARRVRHRLVLCRAEFQHAARALARPGA